MVVNATEIGAPALLQTLPATPLRITVLGLRGVVDVQGGIESHARLLYPLLARLGCEIEVIQRSPYFPPARRRRDWHGVKLTYLWSPMKRGVETSVHTLLGVLYAAWRRPDILHLHGVGPATLAPLARLLGLRVVITHHGAEYDNEKWGAFAKILLRTGERLGMRFAHGPICVSPHLQVRVARAHGVEATLIPNGAPKVLRTTTRATLEELDLPAKRYVLCVARLDPAKRHKDLIAAFQAANLPGWKLAIVGAIRAGDPHIESLAALARSDPRIVLTGYRTGIALRELYSHAGVFVLPSALEGHPISLLEAASYEVPILASAIAANLALPLPRDRFFPLGDTAALAALLRTVGGESGSGGSELSDLHAVIRDRYSWRKVATSTKSVYDSVCGRQRRG